MNILGSPVPHPLEKHKRLTLIVKNLAAIRALAAFLS